MAGWWQTPAVSLPVRLRRPAWRTTAARALPAELMASLSLIPQLITSARSSLMKESPHRDETRGEEEEGRDSGESESVRKRKKKKDCIVGTRKQIEKGQKEKWHLENTNGERNWEAEHQSENEGKNKSLCERKRGGGEVGAGRGPVGKKASLKMHAISLWSLVLVNRVPAVLLFKVKYIHKLIKLPVMINVTEGEPYYGTPAALSINVTLTSWHSKCKTHSITDITLYYIL